MQSLRIRSLESEVSHLLAENVSLREQVINLTQEIERLEAAKLLHDGVYEIKGRLDAKLAELNSLVADLGTLPRKAGRLGGGKSEQSDRPKATAPNSRLRMTDSDYHAEVDDGKLPAILEDKYHPRRTLEYVPVSLPHAVAPMAKPFTDLKRSRPLCMGIPTCRNPQTRQAWRTMNQNLNWTDLAKSRPIPHSRAEPTMTTTRRSLACPYHRHLRLGGKRKRIRRRQRDGTVFSLNTVQMLVSRSP